MRKNPYYELTDEAEIRRLIRENPWATLVSNPETGLVASHYPILLEDDREELSIVTHVGRPDEKVHELGDHELLVIVQGPHGYISSSWYGAHIDGFSASRYPPLQTDSAVLFSAATGPYG